MPKCSDENFKPFQWFLDVKKYFVEEFVLLDWAVFWEAQNRSIHPDRVEYGTVLCYPWCQSNLYLIWISGLCEQWHS